MTGIREQFKKQIELITILSKQIQEMQHWAPHKQRPTKKAHHASIGLLLTDAKPMLKSTLFIKPDQLHPT
jgi:hypothetical protein